MGHAHSQSESIRGEPARTLADVHAELDAIDRALIALLSRRFAMMRTATAAMRGEDLSDEHWHRQLILAARRLAFEQNVPVGLVADMWDRLTDASIALQRQAHARLTVVGE